MTDESPPPLSRPRCIAEMRERLSRFSTTDAAERADALIARDSDVFIATYPKCGTTLMQQLVHTLRTGGDMEFGEITEVVPWLEKSHDLGVDVDAEQIAQPRSFKTHRSRKDLPDNARLLHVTRDPFDMASSFFRFFDGWLFETGSVDLDTFCREMLLERTGSGKYWDHLSDWLGDIDQPNVCFICYEDFLEQPAEIVRKVSSFIGIQADEQLMELTLKHTSIDFMRAHASKFDDHLVRAVTDAQMRLPPGGCSSKVASGKAGRGKTVSDDIRQLFDAEWRRHIGEPFGFADYPAMRASVGLSATS